MNYKPVTGYAEDNLKAAADFDLSVVAATIPLQRDDILPVIAKHPSVQFVSTAEGGLFMIGWNRENPLGYDVYSLLKTAVPVLMTR